MFLAQGAQQAIGSAQTTIMLFGIVAVIFWRPLLKITVMVAAMVTVILLCSGAVVLLHDFHHVVR